MTEQTKPLDLKKPLVAHHPDGYRVDITALFDRGGWVAYDHGHPWFWFDKAGRGFDTLWTVHNHATGSGTKLNKELIL